MNNPQCHLSVMQFLLPKDGLLRSECEDAIGVRCDMGRFCVADGATEAFDSRRWAKLLTRCWGGSNRLLTREEYEPWLRTLGERLERRWTRRPLSWYAEEKSRGGAFAAFVGVAFIWSGDHLSWQATALGDSCLVHRRADSILDSMPISDPEQFGYHPTLVPSNLRHQKDIGDHVKTAHGSAEQHDVFLLLTDAIAAWYLRMASADPSRIGHFDQLLAAGDSEALERMISEQRRDKFLRNDDVAIIRIAIGVTKSLTREA